MILGPWWSFGATAETEQVPQTAQWVWGHTGRDTRIFQPRTRDDYWVEFGHIEDSNPDLDSREG